MLLPVIIRHSQTLAFHSSISKNHQHHHHRYYHYCSSSPINWTLQSANSQVSKPIHVEWMLLYKTSHDTSPKMRFKSYKLPLTRLPRRLSILKVETGHNATLQYGWSMAYTRVNTSDRRSWVMTRQVRKRCSYPVLPSLDPVKSRCQHSERDSHDIIGLTKQRHVTSRREMSWTAMNVEPNRIFIARQHIDTRYWYNKSVRLHRQVPV